MSILNRASDGLFNVLIVLYAIVHESKRIPRDRLISRCTGPLDPKMARQTLNRWEQLGLFQTSAEGWVSIAEKYRCEPDKTSQTPLSKLPAMLRRNVFSDHNNQNFWNSEKSFAADFTRGVAWLLAQDVYAFNSQNFPTVQDLEFSQIKDTTKRVMVNNTRWDGLKEWSVYLGFGWEADGFVIDPTTAIRDVLAEVFGEDKVLAIDRFVNRIATILPVIDTGQYRAQIEDVLDPTVWHRSKENYISTSLSRALKRLDFSHSIQLERKSDAQKASYLSKGGGILWGDPITHVRLSERN